MSSLLPLFATFIFATFVICPFLNTSKNIQIRKIPKPKKVQGFDSFKVFEKRRDLLRKVCLENEISPNDRNLPHFIYIPKMNLTTCYIPKTGSTTWSKHLLAMNKVKGADNRDIHNLHILSRTTFKAPKEPESRRKVANSTMSFIFVRHPFVRFVSAFLMRSNLYCKDVQHLTKRKFSCNNDFARPPFKAFVLAFLNLTETQALKKDHHFDRMFERCDVCHIDWKFIGQVESFDKDLAFISKQLRIKIKRPKLHLNQRNSPNGSIKLTKNYFSLLDEEQILKLYNWFYIDFAAFGYDRFNF